MFLAVDGLEAGPLFVTPKEAVRPAPGGWRRLFGGRAPAPAYACTCPSCRHAFELPGAALPERGGGQPHARMGVRGKGAAVWTGVDPKTATASQGNKYIEWSEEWICPELFTVAI